MQKFKKNLFVLLFLVFLPFGLFASIFGEENVALANILAQLIQQGQTLYEIQRRLTHQGSIMEDAHEGARDRFDYAEDARIPKQNSFNMSDVRWQFGMISGIYWNLKSILEKIYRPVPPTVGYQAMANRDASALTAYEFSENSHQAGYVMQENSDRLIKDLDNASEGKAIVRGAQAEALQVQGLARINDNQALQLKLQAEEILEDNRQRKEYEGVVLGLNRELSRSFGSLKPAGER